MGGKTKVKTVQGSELTVEVKGNAVMLWDEQGNMANVTIADVYQSNGVIHVIDKIVMAK